jgi:hypothetical protein
MVAIVFSPIVVSIARELRRKAVPGVRTMKVNDGQEMSLLEDSGRCHGVVDSGGH